MVLDAPAATLQDELVDSGWHLVEVLERTEFHRADHLDAERVGLLLEVPPGRSAELALLRAASTA
jgi:hypothetical protein